MTIAESDAAPRILVIGDVMTDVVVRPEGPLARGTDRRAKIRFEPGGSAANQAAWLAAFGVAVDFVARVGAAGLAAETARLAAAGVTPHLVGDPERPTGRLVALIDPSGERSFFTDRGRERRARQPPTFPTRSSPARRSSTSPAIRSSPSPRARRSSTSFAGRGRRRSASTRPRPNFLREVGPQAFLDWTRGASLLLPNADEAEVLAGSADPETQCARLAALYPLVVIKRGAAGCSRPKARGAGGSTRPWWKRSTPPAPATPSPPPFSRRGLRARRWRRRFAGGCRGREGGDAGRGTAGIASLTETNWSSWAWATAARLREKVPRNIAAKTF